jgi:glutamate synthase domain-containing protein 2
MEMGLTGQVLAMNNLRERVTLRTDGVVCGIGRDIVMALMLGAVVSRYRHRTDRASHGCIMVRQCQSTRPVGVCTQDEALRR